VQVQADDVGGEAELGFGFRGVSGEHLGRGLAGGGGIAFRAGEEERDEMGEDGFQEDGEDHWGPGGCALGAGIG
jgi:hypothetical protein